eukprot:Tamp_30290.p2 GENE.Tamp_30290~~Tamp_30290.p2  ORF type:complete len:128 (-),score=18.22 Tamp_30290:188-571(-)
MKSFGKSIGRVLLVQIQKKKKKKEKTVMKSFGKSIGRVLLAFEQEHGQWKYRYERPRYAWADTVQRPPCSKPNSQLLVEKLAFPWTADVASDGMTAICKTMEPVATNPQEMADELLTFERSILPRLA